MPNYIERTKARLVKELGKELPSELLDLYTLLVLVKGDAVTLEDVHDAWAVWASPIQPEHRSIIPFAELSTEIQELDRTYAEAIARTASTKE
jgi:hypothetical protein